MARRIERERVARFLITSYKNGSETADQYRSKNSFVRAKAIAKKLGNQLGITRTVIRSRKTGREWLMLWAENLEIGN